MTGNYALPRDSIKVGPTDLGTSLQALADALAVSAKGTSTPATPRDVAAPYLLR